LPQFFQESVEQKELRLQEERERLTWLLGVKQAIGLVEDPSELVMDLSGYLKDIGIGESFLDFEELKRRGQKQSIW